MYLSGADDTVKIAETIRHVNFDRFLPPYPMNVYCASLLRQR